MTRDWGGPTKYYLPWGLRVRVTALVLTGILVAGSGSYAVLLTFCRHWLVQDLDSRGRSLAELLAQRASTSLLLGDTRELKNEVKRAGGEPDVVGVSIHRGNGPAVVSRINQPRNWSEVGPADSSLSSAARGSVLVRRLPGLESRTFVVPVLRQPHAVSTPEAEAGEVFGFLPPANPPPSEEERVGWVRLTLSTRRLELAVARVGRIGLGAMALFLALGLVAAVGLMRIVVRPLREASELAREIAAGRLDRRLPVRGEDELGALAESMNLMASRLGEARRAAQEEASALRRATQAVVAVAQGARAAERPSEVFPVVAEQLRRVTGCTAVALAVPGPAGEPATFAHFDPAPPWGGLDTGLALDPAVAARLGRSDGTPVRMSLDPAPGSFAWGLLDAGYRVALLVPLTLEEGALAMLLLASREPAAFPSSQVDVVGGLASHLSAVLHAEQLRLRLETAFDELERTRDQLVRSEKLRMAGELASAVAHEFNNLLGAILGRAELLRARAKDGRLKPEELTAGLRVMERAAQDGADTVRRLRQFATGPDAGKREAVDLGAILRDAAEFTRVRWQNVALAEGRTIQVRVDAAAGCWVSGRASELREVFTNLVLNAVDAIPGNGDVWLRSRLEGERVIAWVNDPGVGMSEETRARVFDPFFTTKGEHGTGLGLSVVYGIVQRHGGHIAIHSEPGHGTRVEVSFPRAAPPAPAPVETSAAPSPVALPAKAELRVLVVDDEAPVLELLADIIEALGHEAASFSRAEAALAEFRAGHYDLVLTDLGMPGMTGREFSRALRDIDPKVPLAWITGWGEEVGEEASQRGDADAVVAKPFTIEDVSRLLRLAEERRAAREAA